MKPQKNINLKLFPQLCLNAFTGWKREKNYNRTNI